MNLDRFEIPPIGENCYILHKNKKALVFDPGGSFEGLKEFIDSNHLEVKYILLTHGHFDHIGAAAELRQHSGAPILIHEGDEALMREGPAWAQSFGLRPFPEAKADKLLKDNDIINFEDLSVKVIHTPGHTPGGVCFFIEPGNILFSGDTLFSGSVGRTDFPGGSGTALEKSIKEKLYILPEDTLVYPGHGGGTSIGREKKTNPIVRYS